MPSSHRVWGKFAAVVEHREDMHPKSKRPCHDVAKICRGLSVELSSQPGAFLTEVYRKIVSRHRGCG